MTEDEYKERITQLEQRERGLRESLESLCVIAHDFYRDYESHKGTRLDLDAISGQFARFLSQVRSSEQALTPAQKEGES